MPYLTLSLFIICLGILLPSPAQTATHPSTTPASSSAARLPAVTMIPALAPEPQGQDAHYGRDAQARDGTLPKVGAGAAGFDFTKLAN